MESLSFLLCNWDHFRIALLTDSLFAKGLIHGDILVQPVPVSPTLYVWIFLPSVVGVVVENHHHQQLLDMRVVVLVEVVVLVVVMVLVMVLVLVHPV